MSDTDVGFWLSLNAYLRELSVEEHAAIAERISKRLHDMLVESKRLEQLRRYQMICGLFRSLN